jgi:hypothetical protein
VIVLRRLFTTASVAIFGAMGAYLVACGPRPHAMAGLICLSFAAWAIAAPSSRNRRSELILGLIAAAVVVDGNPATHGTTPAAWVDAIFAAVVGIVVLTSLLLLLRLTEFLFLLLALIVEFLDLSFAIVERGLRCRVVAEGVIFIVGVCSLATFFGVPGRVAFVSFAWSFAVYLCLACLTAVAVALGRRTGVYIGLFAGLAGLGVGIVFSPVLLLIVALLVAESTRRQAVVRVLMSATVTMLPSHAQTAHRGSEGEHRQGRRGLSRAGDTVRHATAWGQRQAPVGKGRSMAVPRRLAGVAAAFVYLVGGLSLLVGFLNVTGLLAVVGLAGGLAAGMAARRAKMLVSRIVLFARHVLSAQGGLFACALAFLGLTGLTHGGIVAVDITALVVSAVAGLFAGVSAVTERAATRRLLADVLMSVAMVILPRHERPVRCREWGAELDHLSQIRRGALVRLSLGFVVASIRMRAARRSLASTGRR